ncbi:MAG: hypothetical protein AAF581_17170 [Planctomycetota bacterium]
MTVATRKKSDEPSRWAEMSEKITVSHWVAVALLLAVLVCGAVVVMPRDELALAREADAATQEWLADQGLPTNFDPSWWLLPGGSLLLEAQEAPTVQSQRELLDRAGRHAFGKQSVGN